MRWITFFAVCLLGTTLSAAPLKVVCRMGQPPFNDAESVTAGKCVGLFADAFYMAMNKTGLDYTLDIMNVNSVDSLVSLDKVTGQSKYDIALTYQTETATRQAIYDFSVALEQSADCIALRPAYRKAVGTLTGAVIRDSVLYVFLVWCLLALFMALVILLFEWLNPQSEMQSMPLWVRPLHAIEMGFEVVGTFGTSEDMESQVTRSLRSVIAIMGFFIVTVFASAVTSQLTSSSLSSQTVTVRDVRGVNIAIASSTLLGYLNGFGVGANASLVNNLNQFAQEFYTGGQAGYDGFSTACDIVSYLHNIHGADKLGFIISEPYFKSGNGAYDLRALPYSKALNKTVRNLIDTALSDIRESGVLAGLISKWVPAAPPKPGTDLPVDDTFTVIKAVVGVFYGGMMVIVAALFVYHYVVAKHNEDERERAPAGRGDHYSPNEKYAMVWKHKKFKEIDDESRAMIQHILAAHGRTHPPVEMVVVKSFEVPTAGHPKDHGRYLSRVH